jgi:hypothetical protein
MTYSDPIPRPPSPELISSAQNLHDILADSFDRPFEALGYKADFDSFPPSHAAIYTGRSKELLTRLTTEPLHKGRAWNIEVGYNPTDEQLAIAALTIPFQPADGTYHDLVIQRITSSRYNGSYLVLERTAPDAELAPYETEVDKLEKAVFDTEGMYIVPESHVLQLAHLAGYTHPRLFTKPNDLLVHMAETLDAAYRWERTESITVPLSEGYQLLLRRGAAIEPTITSTPAILAERYKDEPIAPAASIQHQRDGWLEATIESVGVTRKQTVIHFDYEDHFVKLPTITTQEVAPATDDTSVANYGPDATVVQNKASVEVTVEMFDLLAESLLDELGDQ